MSALRKIKKTREFKGKRVAAHLPFEKVLSFPLLLQLGREETLEEAIVRETQDYIPFPIEEAVIDYPSVLRTSTEPAKAYRVTVIASRMKDIQHYHDTLKKAGLSLETVDFPVSSLYRLHAHQHEASEIPVILCHIGGYQTLAAVVQHNGILGERAFTWGFGSLATKIQNQMELKNDRYKAKILLKNYGLSSECGPGADADAGGTAIHDTICQILYQIIAPYAEELVDELHRLIAYIRSGDVNTTFEGVYLYGQGAAIHGLDAYVENRLNLPTTSVDPTEWLATTNGLLLSHSMDKNRFSLSLGLGMRKFTWL